MDRFLAYFPHHNVLLNIECKDILPAFCMKDDSRIRRKFFGDNSLDNKGYLGKVENRATYLCQHTQRILEIFDWKSLHEESPTIISIFVTRRSYWWTRFPPVETDVRFMTVAKLRDFLVNL
jgi:hypothetical protein